MGRCRCLFVTQREPASREGAFVGDLPLCAGAGEPGLRRGSLGARVGRHLIVTAPAQRGLTRLWMKETSSERSSRGPAGDRRSAKVNY